MKLIAISCRYKDNLTLTEDQGRKMLSVLRQHHKQTLQHINVAGEIKIYWSV